MNFFKHKKIEENIINPDEQKINQLLEIIKNHYGTRKFEVKNEKPTTFTKDTVGMTIAHFNGNDIHEINAHWDSPIGFLLQNNKTENLHFSKEDISFLLKKCDINLTHGNGVSIASLLIQNNQKENIFFNKNEMMEFLEKADLSIVNTKNQSVFGTILEHNHELQVPQENLNKWAIKAIQQNELSKPIGKDILNYIANHENIITSEVANLIVENQKNLSSYQKEQSQSNYQEILKKIEKIYPNIIKDIQKEKVEKKIKDCVNTYRKPNNNNTIKDIGPQIK